MAKPKSPNGPTNLYVSQILLDMANRATLLTGYESGVLLRNVVHDRGHATFYNQALNLEWSGARAIRHAMAFYSGLLATLVDKGAPLHADVLEYTTAVRGRMDTDRDDSDRKELRKWYDQGGQWAEDFLTRRR